MIYENKVTKYGDTMFQNDSSDMKNIPAQVLLQ